MDFLRKLIFGDWVLHDAYLGKWTINEIDFGFTRDETCTYEILYSPYRNIYKLKLSGYKPKRHKMYAEVARQVGKLNEGLINKKNEQHR